MVYFGPMNSTLRAWICVGVAALGSLPALGIPANASTNQAALKENYQSIVERNPFGLKPIPVVETVKPVVETNKPSELFLTGISTIGFPQKPKRAYLMTKDPAKKYPYYTLSEGQEQDGIKVLEIKENEVKIRQNGSDIAMTFASHGIKAAAPPPPPAGGAGGPPGPGGLPGPGLQPGGMPHPNPAAQPGSNPQVNNPGAPSITPVRSMPTRPIRTQPDNLGPTYTGNNAVPAPAMETITAAPQTGNAPAAQPEIDPAEQYLRLKLQETARRKQGLPTPPIPPVR